MYRMYRRVFCITSALASNIMTKVASFLILLVFWHKPLAGVVDVLTDNMSNDTRFLRSG